MSIIRVQRDDRFTVIPNEIINDDDLDGSTLGVLVYLLSKPPTWKVTIASLSSTKRFGSHGKLTSILKTLRSLGYAELKRFSDGHTEWTITDSKRLFTSHSQKRNKDTATDTEITPPSENRNVEIEPHSENPHVENRNVLERTERNKKKEVVSKKQKISISENWTWENIDISQMNLWANAYPAINIDTELAKAASWLNANPENRKSNYARFLNGWFQRAQDRAPRTKNEQSQYDPQRSDTGFKKQQRGNYSANTITREEWNSTDF